MKKQYNIKDYLKIKFASATSFSPNGRNISIISNLTGTNQLYLISRSGGKLKQLTSYEEPVYFGSFSPTEEKIMFGMSKGGNENTQLYLYDVKKKSVKKITKNSNCVFRWGGWSQDGKNIAYSSNERNGTDFDVYVKNLKTGEARCIFNKGGQCNSYGFSPSGRFLTVGKMITNVSNEVYLINLMDGSEELIVTSKGESQNGSPKWLPNEEGFYYLSNSGQDYLGLCYYSLCDKKSKYLLTKEWDIESVSLTRDGRYIAMGTNEDGFEKLAIYTADNLKLLHKQRLPKGTSFYFGWSNDGKHLLVSTGSPTESFDAWAWSRESNKLNRLTTSPSSVPRNIFVEPELIHYTSFDGLKIPALLYTPKKTPQARKLPVIINIHGGPKSQARPVFSSISQYFVSAGYAVIYPNVRGSSGYGKKYMHLDNVEKRMDSVADIAALHKYLLGRKEIDASRAALMGGSYGGFMVLAGLAFYPDLWAAGIDVVGISNFVTFLENTSPYRRAHREAEYGSLKKDRKFLESISPFNFIEKIKSPLFIIHGKNDPRVPLSEAEQIYTKLSELKKDVELLVYPDEGHGLAKLKNRLDAYPKMVTFLDSILKN